MPATKKPGDEVYSGSTCKQGEIEAVVIATGVHTFFGKAAHLVDSTNNVGHFQKVIFQQLLLSAMVEKRLSCMSSAFLLAIIIYVRSTLRFASRVEAQCLCLPIWKLYRSEGLHLL